MGIKKNKNDSFLLYADTLNVIEQLPTEVRNKATLVIFDYGAGKELNDPFITIDGEKLDLRKFFRQIFNGIDVEKRRYANKEKISAVQTVLGAKMEKEGESKRVKDYERALAELKKLYNEVRRHDIENVDERISFIIQSNPSAGYTHVSTADVHTVEQKLISRWTEYLKEDERENLLNLISKAELSWKTVNDGSNRPIRVR